MTLEKLEAAQKYISKEIVRIVEKEVVINRCGKLQELNLMLDSLNRAAHYLMKEKTPEK